MTRYVYAAGATLFTGLLVTLSIAIAQRDARVASTPEESTPTYAQQTAEPIALENNTASSWPPNPKPIVRGNDNLPSYPRSTLASYADPSGSLSDEPSSDKGLAEPPPFSASPAFESGKPSTNSLPLMSAPSGGAAAAIRSKNQGTTSLPPSTRSELPPLPNSGLPGSFPSTMKSNESQDATASLNNSAFDASTSRPSFGGNSNPDDRYSQGATASPFASNGPPANYPNSASGLPLSTPSLPSSSLPASSSTQSLPRMPPSFSSNSSSANFSDSTPLQSVPSLRNDLRDEPGDEASNMISPNTAPVATLGSPLPTDASSSQNWTELPSASPSTMNPNATHPGASIGNDASPRNRTVLPVAATRSSAAPGVRQLDGSQNPSMEIQKRAPSEVQVGLPATFTLLVRNVGNATAYDVNVVDSIPKGAKLVRTSPQAQSNPNGGLVWSLGEMSAGQEQLLTIELIPESEGEIGSVASVNFSAQASVRTISTQPKLVVKQVLEPMIRGGDSLRIMIEVTNTGTGTARDVRLEEDVPNILRHTTGESKLSTEVGDLAPGESHRVSIELTATSAGKMSNVVRAVSENAASHESSAPIEVVLPKLQLGISGPRLRYLERQATYQASIANTGTAVASDVRLMVYLPRGMEFNSAANEGTYLSDQHAILWNLAELAAGAHAATEFTVLPVAEGDCALRMQGRTAEIQAEPIEKQVRIEGQSELTFGIEDDNDPIETDGKTTYVIKITNIGTRVDQDIQLVVDLPEGAIVEQTSPPVNYQPGQRSVVFPPIAQMQSKDQQVIRMSVRHTREGTHVLRAQLKSKLRPVAVIKEESTQVYRDQ